MKLTHYSRFAISYAVAVAATLIVGILSGETRIDLYLSLYILEYFLFSAIYGVRISLFLSVLLFALFSAIVAYRISLILSPVILP